LKSFSNKLNFLQFFLILFALTLSIDVWLQYAHHSSLCLTTACQVVGGYVRFGELMLIKAGAIFFWVLWLLVFFAGRYDKKWLWGLISLVLMGALAFDGGLLGFQFMGLQEHCQLCIGVGLALLILVVLFAWIRKSLLIFLLGIAVWCGGFAANSVLIFPTDLPVLQKTAFLSWPRERESAPAKYVPRYHLFFSLSCGHCSRVIANLAVNTTDQVDWTFHIMDHRDADLQRLAHILASNQTSANPFLEILHWESEEKVPPIAIPDSLKDTIELAKTYFTRSGFRGVPTLIVDERPGVRVILAGANNITLYLHQKGLLQQVIRFSGSVHKEEEDPLPPDVTETK